jgi:GntR family transcriptional regulator
MTTSQLSEAERFRLVKADSAATPQTSPRRVHDLLRAAIRTGELEPGQHLVEWQLVKEYATSRNAVREALQMLATEGLVTRSPREGTTVVGNLVKLPLDDMIRAGDTDIVIRRLNDRRVPSTAPVRSRLRTEAAEVGVIEHLFTYRGEPLGVWLTYYHAHATQPLFWKECPDLATAFEFIYYKPLGRVEITVEALPCEPRTMRLLGLREPVTMLVKEHVMYDVDGVPQDVSYAHYRADRVSFSINSTRFQV